MRYTKEHKQETRQRIIATAGRRLKQDGIDGSGVATLMKDAGLTNGTFCAYFASKDHLVATAVADQMRAQHENIVAQAAPGRAGLEQIVRWYFSPEQRDNICGQASGLRAASWSLVPCASDARISLRQASRTSPTGSARRDEGRAVGQLPCPS